MDVIKIRISDLQISKAPNILRTYSLGSCVGVVLYDRKKKVGGMAHIMLPTSNGHRDQLVLAKYANTAIPELIKQLKQVGISTSNLVAYLAGGAEMFKTSDNFMKIGHRNVEATKKILGDLGIPIIIDETGGEIGRTINFFLETGELEIKVIKKTNN